MKSRKPVVSLKVGSSYNSLCYLVNVFLELFEEDRTYNATSIRITYATKRTDLLGIDQKKSFEVDFNNSFNSFVKGCVEWNNDNKCTDERIFSTSSPKPFKIINENINVTVVYNAPDSPNHATMVCIKPDSDFRRFKFFSKVEGLYEGTVGDSFDPSDTIEWKDARNCGPSQYLDNTNENPLKWKCEACPKGAGCHGDVVWTDVQALTGYYRLRKEDCACCGTPPSELHPQGVFYNKEMAANANCIELFEGTVPDQFEKCVYPTSCLGAPNENLAGQYFIEHETTGESATLTIAQAIERKLISVPPNKLDKCTKKTVGVAPAKRVVIHCDVALDTTFREECNEMEGFANNCSRWGKKTECRLCRTCLPGYYGDGFSPCQQCPPIEGTFTLTFLAIFLMFGMLYLFLKTALEEAEHLSNKDTNFTHLAHSMQKILTVNL